MIKKNQSKSIEKVLPLKTQKKPLPKPDPSLIQIAYKVHKESIGTKGKESMGTKGKESIGTKGKESIGTKGKESIGIKRHK